MQSFIDYALARAAEPSTWAGVAAALVAHAHLAGGDAGTVSSVLAGIAGLIAIILKEKGVA